MTRNRRQRSAANCRRGSMNHYLPLTTTAAEDSKAMRVRRDGRDAKPPTPPRELQPTRYFAQISNAMQKKMNNEKNAITRRSPVSPLPSFSSTSSAVFVALWSLSSYVGNIVFVNSIPSCATRAIDPRCILAYCRAHGVLYYVMYYYYYYTTIQERRAAETAR